MPRIHNLDDIIVIALNFKKRLSGVTSTVIQLLPLQRDSGYNIAALGPGLPNNMPKVQIRKFWKLWSRPHGAQFRVWHARRNIEMLPGIILRDIFNMKLKLLFTSAAQRDHRTYTKWLISKMDHVIATSAKSASYLNVENTVVPHGIDLNKFSPSHNKRATRQSLGLDPDKKIVGCFGRIRHQKGTDIFVDLMVDLLPKHPDWIAVITGRVTVENEDFEKSLVNKIVRAGLSERILLKGEVAEITPWFQALDLYIAPQRWEGFGLTPLEAAACAIPTVATDVGAFSDIISNNETGNIIEIEDLAAMIKHSDNLMTDSQMLEKYGIAARKRAEEHFSLEREISGIGRIYNQLAQTT